MKLKALKRRFGAQAPKVAVRPQVPWYVRWFGLSCAAAATAAVVWFAYHYGQSFAGFEQHEAESARQKLSVENAQLEKDNTALKSDLAVVERQLQIERAAQADLAKQVKILSLENARLKEDIALLQTISVPNEQGDGIRLSSVRIEPNAVPGEYTYRIVLVQTGSRAKPFQGNYQLVVSVVKDGKPSGVVVPDGAEKASNAYRLDFRVHQRVDGTFKVAPGAEVRSVQVRVFEGKQTQPKVMQTVAVS